MSTDYNQRSVVTGLHSIPRFGHTSSFSSLTSSDEEERSDYSDGIVAFSVLLLMITLVWCAVLLVLKFYAKEKRVGCAAGGRVVDVTEMRDHKLSRSVRRRRILRNWRVQYCLLLCCVLIPTLSFLFVNHGFVAVSDSLDEVQDMTGIAREQARTGIEIATDLMYAQNRLHAILNSFELEKACPNYELYDDDEDDVIQTINATLNNGMDQVNTFVDEHVSNMVIGLSQMTQTSLYVEESIEEAQSYEWLVKGFLIALNAVNIFLLVGVCLTRSSIYHYTYQKFLTYLVVPSFCVVLLGFVAATCVSAALAMVNADFCSGGSDPSGSPQGTLQDIFETNGFNSSNLPYQALLYYSSDCNGANPFSFINNFQTQVESQRLILNDLMQDVQDGTLDFEQVCGEDIVPVVNSSMFKVQEKLGDFEELLSSAVNLTSCTTVQPLFRRLINGAPCSEAPRGMAWLFGTTASILFVGLVMLSVRAGLYNPVVKPRRIKRREREFQEYKEYMSNYYKTEGWRMDPNSIAATPSPDDKKKLSLAKTFDTEGTESDTGSNNSPQSPPDDNMDSSMFSDNQSLYIEDGTVESSAIPAARSATRSSRLRYRDPGVVYYESDSDDNDSTNETSSHMSDVFGRLFLARRGANNTGSTSTDSRARTGATITTVRGTTTSSSSFPTLYLHGSSSSSSSSNTSSSQRSLRIQTATPLTPSGSRNKSSPRVVSFDDAPDDERGPVMVIRDTLETQPLSPVSPDKQEFPARPSKKHKHRCRTIGGSMMEIA